MVTRHTYDEGGRLVASVTEREPEWSRTDVESLIAYMETQRVGPHGYPMNMATSRAGDPSNPDREFDWVAPLPDLDHATAALERMKTAYKKAYPDADMSALIWRVEKRDRAT